MTYADWAEGIARSVLEEPLPRRWAHTQGVAAAARTLAPVLGRHADLLTAAALLHDIGYAPALHDSGFHPLDGARYLRDIHAETIFCRLVAHHSCAMIEADERGLAADLIREFKPAPHHLTDALIYCDMTAGPHGQPMTVEQRLTEIQARYGPGHVVTRALARSGPHLTAAVARMTRKLAQRTPPPRQTRLVPALAGAS
jgi:putative nucleotidyltransferase with HDIG domain